MLPASSSSTYESASARNRLLDRRLKAFDGLFLSLNLNTLLFEVQANSGIQIHVNISDPDKCKKRDQISPPVGIQQFESCDEQEEDCDVMAEAVFTRKKIEEFTFDEAITLLAVLLAPVPRLAEDFFMCYGPRYARNGQAEDK